MFLERRRENVFTKHNLLSTALEPVFYFYITTIYFVIKCSLLSTNRLCLTLYVLLIQIVKPDSEIINKSLTKKAEMLIVLHLFI